MQQPPLCLHKKTSEPEGAHGSRAASGYGKEFSLCSSKQMLSRRRIFRYQKNGVEGLCVREFTDDKPLQLRDFLQPGACLGLG